MQDTFENFSSKIAAVSFYWSNEPTVSLTNVKHSVAAAFSNSVR